MYSKLKGRAFRFGDAYYEKNEEKALEKCLLESVPQKKDVTSFNDALIYYRLLEILRKYKDNYFEGYRIYQEKLAREHEEANRIWADRHDVKKKEPDTPPIKRLSLIGRVSSHFSQLVGIIQPPPHPRKVANSSSQ